MNDKEHTSPVGQSMQVTHDYYGVPLWLMKDYLTQLGGHQWRITSW